MEIFIKEEFVNLTKRAYLENRSIILLLFFIPLIFFTGYLIGIISTGIHLIVMRYVDEGLRERFFETMLPVIIILPFIIFYLTSRIFKAKRLLVVKGLVSMEDHIIKIGNMKIPIGSIKIEIYRKAAFLPGNVYLVSIYFTYGRYLYKFGESPDFTFVRELNLHGIRSVKNIKNGDRIMLMLPLSITQLNKLIYALKKHSKYMGVFFKTKNKSIRALFKDFEERKNARIIVKDFSMIGF